MRCDAMHWGSSFRPQLGSTDPRGGFPRRSLRETAEAELSEEQAARMAAEEERELAVLSAEEERKRALVAESARACSYYSARRYSTSTLSSLAVKFWL